MVEGRSAEALKALAQAFMAHGRTEQIALISMGMSPTYQSGASQFSPQAQITLSCSALCNCYPKLATCSRTSLPLVVQELQLSLLQPFRELAHSIQEHWSGVVVFLKTRLTNGAIQAVNGPLQLKRLARGFRSLRYFRIMAYLKAAGLHLDLPSPVTHSK